MHLVYKKIRCIGLAVAILFLCTACSSVPLADRRIVKAIFFEKTRAECMVTLLLQQQDEDRETIIYGRGQSFAEALYSAQRELDGEAFYGTVEIAAFPYECSWVQVETIGELLYDKVAPIPEISVFQLDKPIEQGNKKLYDKQFEEMKEKESEYKFHWGLESVFSEQKQCVLPFLREDGYGCAVIGKQESGNILTQYALEAQLLAVMSGHSTKINTEPAGIDAAVTADAHIEHIRIGNAVKATLVLDKVQWTALQDNSQDRKTQEKALIDEIKSIFAGNQSLFGAQGTDPFHIGFYSEIYGGTQTNVLLEVVLNNEKPGDTG